MGIESFAPMLGPLGTLFGLITSLFQRYNDHKKLLMDLEKLKVQNEHELKMRELDAKLIEREYAARSNVAILEHDARIAEADAQLRLAVTREESEHFSRGINPDKLTARVWVFLDAVRALVRPVLTAVITAAFTMVAIIAILKVIREGGLDHYRLAEQALGMLNFSMNSVVSHYFITRNKASEALSRKT